MKHHILMLPPNGNKMAASRQAVQEWFDKTYTPYNEEEQFRRSRAMNPVPAFPNASLSFALATWLMVPGEPPLPGSAVAWRRGNNPFLVEDAPYNSYRQSIMGMSYNSALNLLPAVVRHFAAEALIIATEDTGPWWSQNYATTKDKILSLIDEYPANERDTVFRLMRGESGRFVTSSLSRGRAQSLPLRLNRMVTTTESHWEWSTETSPSPRRWVHVPRFRSIKRSTARSGISVHTLFAGNIHTLNYTDAEAFNFDRE